MGAHALRNPLRIPNNHALIISLIYNEWEGYAYQCMQNRLSVHAKSLIMQNGYGVFQILVIIVLYITTLYQNNFMSMCYIKYKIR